VGEAPALPDGDPDEYQQPQVSLRLIALISVKCDLFDMIWRWSKMQWSGSCTTAAIG